MARVPVSRAVRRWARTYVHPPSYRSPLVTELIAPDGVRLFAHVLPGPADPPASVVVCHGAMNWSRSPRIVAFAEALSAHVPIVVPDLRGHGRSGGLVTMGEAEPLDVEAAVTCARSLAPGRPVVTIGASLGAVAALLHAGRFGGVHGVVALSAPAWSTFDRDASERLWRMVTTSRGRAFSRVLLRTRVSPAVGPLEDGRHLIAAISPAFLAVAHDPDDSYFGPEHAESLFSWAGEPRHLWWYPGGGHGGELLTPALVERVLRLIRDEASVDRVAPGTGERDQWPLSPIPLLRVPRPVVSPGDRLTAAWRVSGERVRGRASIGFPRPDAEISPLT